MLPVRVPGAGGRTAEVNVNNRHSRLGEAAGEDTLLAELRAAVAVADAGGLAGEVEGPSRRCRGEEIHRPLLVAVEIANLGRALELAALGVDLLQDVSPCRQP